MIIQYTFPVKGNLLLTHDPIFKFKGRTYRFEFKNQQITHLIVSTKGDINRDAPQFSVAENKEGQKIHHLNIRDGYIQGFIAMEVRNLEGILSLFGIEEIDTQNPEINWIAENEEEAKKIPIKNFKHGYEKLANDKPLPPDIIARAIVASYDAFELEIPLTFYRKATVSYNQNRYLESCYDYFFFLECLFADSKVKKADVQRKFRESATLQRSIQWCLNDNGALNMLSEISPSRASEFQTKITQEISDFLVDFRGEIHHYKSRHKKHWHPSKPNEAKFEATLFKYIAWNIAMELSLDRMYRDKIKSSDIICSVLADL